MKAEREGVKIKRGKEAEQAGRVSRGGVRKGGLGRTQ